MPTISFAFPSLQIPIYLEVLLYSSNIDDDIFICMPFLHLLVWKILALQYVYECIKSVSEKYLVNM
jgi:hypothetical protein